MFKRVNPKREREKENEAECVYGYRRPLFFSLSLSRDCRSSSNRKEKKKNRRKKQQEAIRADGQVIHLSRKLSLLSTMS